MPVAPVVSSDTKRGDKSMEPESVMTDKMRSEFEKWLDKGNHCGCNETIMERRARVEVKK